MSKLLVSRVVSDFMKTNMRYADDYTKEAISDFLRDAIERGKLVIHEPKNAYTFGGITAELTDSQFATAIAYAIAHRKITAIKEVRQASGVGLKEAKDFVDHLSLILDLSDTVEMPDWR